MLKSTLTSVLNWLSKYQKTSKFSLNIDDFNVYNYSIEIKMKVIIFFFIMSNV
jgi:hypothetical protein